jgi:hypothetical protein
LVLREPGVEVDGGGGGTLRERWGRRWQRDSVNGLRKRTAVAHSEAGVEAAPHSEAGVEAATSSEARDEDGRQRWHNNF